MLNIVCSGSRVYFLNFVVQNEFYKQGTHFCDKNKNRHQKCDGVVFSYFESWNFRLRSWIDVMMPISRSRTRCCYFRSNGAFHQIMACLTTNLSHTDSFRHKKRITFVHERRRIGKQISKPQEESKLSSTSENVQNTFHDFISFFFF